MDVRGLGSFMEANKARFSEKILLNNSYLIICLEDLANYLYRSVCRDSNSPVNDGCDLFGPNLILYAQKVEEYFNLLDRCGIKPIIVEGKSLLRTEEKWKHEYNYLDSDLFKREKEGNSNITKLRNIPKKVKSSRVEPSPLIYVIFREIVKKLDIETRHSNEKCHLGIIKLSNELNCPVLTYDSSYLMYPMRKGFMRPYADLFGDKWIKSDGMNNWSIPCHLFNHKKLISAVPGLQSKSVPFLGVIMDLDLPESESEYDSKYKPITKALSSIQKNNKSQLKQQYKLHELIGSYLEWMRFKSWKELREELCDLVDGRLQVSDTRIVRLSRKLREELGIAMDQRLDNEIGLDYKTFLQAYYLQRNDSAKTAVDYLINLVEEMRLDSYILHIMTCRQVYYDLICRNDPNKVSTNCLKIRPYSVVLCLLRPTALVNEQVNENSIWLFDRLEKDRYAERVIKEARELEGFGSLDHLHVNSLLGLSDDDKKKLLLSTFRVKSDQFDVLNLVKNPDLIDEIRLCLMIVNYINEESKLGDYKTAPLDRSFVKALILTCLFYMTSQFNQPLSGLPVEEVLVVRRELEAVKRIPNDRGDLEDLKSPECSLYLNIIHQISSIECAMDVFCMLNSLLGQIFSQPRLGVWFDGPLIFKVARIILTGRMNRLTCLNLPVLKTIVGNLLPRGLANQL